jgi:uncharacterized protein YPO0396
VGRPRIGSRRLRDSGGNELSGLTSQLENLHGRLAHAKSRRDELVALAGAVSTSFTSQADFETLQQDARAFTRGINTWNERYQERRDEARDALRPLEERRREINNDLRQLAESGTHIRGPLADLREIVAHHLRMRTEDLPYIAELLDLRPGEEKWRTAIETVLGGEARQIVIPAERRREIARALNDLNLRGRVRLIDGNRDEAPRFPLEGATGSDQADRILGKLSFADHRYAGWLQAHIADGALNALCVNHPDELDSGGFRVTVTGQTRRGIRSAAGRAHSDNILGFSNAEDLTRLDDERTQVERDLVAAKALLDKLDAENRAHSDRRTTYASIETYRWDEVDVDGLTSRIATLESRQAELLSADNRLQELAGQIEVLKELHKTAQREETALQGAAETHRATWAELCERKDARFDELAPHEHDDEFTLSEDQEAYLASVYAQVTAEADTSDPIVEANRFIERLAGIKTALGIQQKDASIEVERCEKALLKTFELYQSNWYDPNLDIALACYPDFLRILEELEAAGLYQNREEWQRAVAEWVGEDLLPLAQSMSSEIDAIKTRIVPINDILANQPFGARRGRLKLKVDDINPETVRQFRIKLRKMATLATKSMSFDQMRTVFADLEDFMVRLRGPKDAKYSPEKSDRDRLLDVRRHVEVYAVEYPAIGDAWAAQEHRQLGSASGGESQELIAFIIGSALRFRLGDELRDRPRFAPVFLDEGFVKADSQFAGRAVSAWRGLKFQIIVGAPEDKFTGLEQHMDSFVVIQKDESTGYAYIDHITDHDTNTDTGADTSEELDVAGVGVGERLVPTGADS